MFLTMLAGPDEDGAGAETVFFMPGLFLAANDAKTLLAPEAEDTRTFLGPAEDDCCPVTTPEAALRLSRLIPRLLARSMMRGADAEVCRVCPVLK